MRRIIVLMLAVAGACASATATAQEPPAWPRARDVRLAAAEIAVMAGDARRLAEETALPPLRRQGLSDRLMGAASALPLLLRQAGRAAPPGEVEALRAAIAAGAWADVRARLAALEEGMPLDTTGLLPPDTRPRARRMARALHDGLCAACHDGQPLDADALLPAEDLFAAARVMPQREFTARLLAGVRGDGLTAFAQPLGDADLSALLGLYGAAGE